MQDSAKCQPLFDRFLEQILKDLGSRVDRVVQLFGPVLIEDAVEAEEVGRQTNYFGVDGVDAVDNFCSRFFSYGLKNYFF